MDVFARSVQGVVQFLQEAVEREWRSPEERRFHSELQGPWFDEVARWLEQFAGHELWQTAGERMDEVRAFSRGVRDELGYVLSRIEPQLAMSVLCGLPASQGLGYTHERLALSLGVENGQVLSWEQEGYARMRTLLNERTPLLAYVLALSVELEAQNPVKESEPEDVEALVGQAGFDPDFDLRRYVSPAMELELRQWFHKWGVESPFPDDEGRELAVALVQARLKWEMSAGEEESEDA
ncbi:hypothetical protein JJB07_04875 [Tumebacillus sp. ITR2]|uniref:Uncharacterized protein n=1 Tax=Tumebacillus amylolyticus TaxID=2801339 RepID=A0ABS1J6U5_9BACL|nr:hypothetical protein [Tumebacillus amylolyticus]MBL0385979.1 hypothetical protein [Tumebacillus amylolyticus]